ncbi:MAG: AbaSI family restriction endonuclease [Ethanoligenens sp.]
MQDIKRDYLIKTFSRTKRKDYENYIVNAIWHRLNRLDIQPVTQQYVKRSDGKWALLDLYFPQINFAVECDEAYHINNSDNDMTRELTMEEMLSSVEETAGFRLRRVEAYECIDSIDQQVGDVVAEIKDILGSTEIVPWDIYTPAYELAIRQGSLSIFDNFRFDTIAASCRCFGKHYKNMQRSFFNIGQNYHIWCPQLAVDKGNTLQAASAGWLNILSDNWKTITEINTEGRMGKLEENNSRITFAKSRDVLGRNAYRFIGVYRYSAEESDGSTRIYKRIQPCQHAPVLPTRFSIKKEKCRWISWRIFLAIIPFKPNNPHQNRIYLPISTYVAPIVNIACLFASKILTPPLQYGIMFERRFNWRSNI